MLRLYKVSVNVSYTVEEVVEARTQEEAEMLATNQAAFALDREVTVDIEDVEDLGEADFADFDDDDLAEDYSDDMDDEELDND